jgi:DAK2 domain fusion protein YloV
VILSQILKGFADSIREHRRLTGADLAEALSEGSAAAYAAVMKPVEGTILTVIRESSEAAQSRFTGDNGAVGVVDAADITPLDLLQSALYAGRESLARTPELLPILKQAGVVDAGGHGLLRIFEGLIAYFKGLPLPPKPTVEQRAQQQFDEEEFGFCTEFLLADVDVPTQVIRDLVAPYGDSLLVVGAEGFVKGHIHTEEPEKLLADVARFGRMVRSKVEDMSEQHSEILADVDAAHAQPPSSAAVAVANGYGVTRVFRSLGVRVVGGGQTDNPSVEDIVDAVRSVGAQDVIIMPNNKNIIMAAERVGELVTDKRVHVLPTSTLGQGLAAAVLFQEGIPADTLIDEMQSAADSSMTLEVTRATRDVELNGVMVRNGDAIGLVDGTLVASQRGYGEVLLELLKGRADAYEIASLFFAPSVGQDTAEALMGRIHQEHPNLELELHAGAPDLYPYLMVLE